MLRTELHSLNIWDSMVFTVSLVVSISGICRSTGYKFFGVVSERIARVEIAMNSSVYVILRKCSAPPKGTVGDR